MSFIASSVAFLILSLALSNVLLTDCWTSITSGCSGIRNLAIFLSTSLSCSFTIKYFVMYPPPLSELLSPVSDMTPISIS